MRTELKVYVSEKWRLYLSVCAYRYGCVLVRVYECMSVWVYECMSVGAQPDVKYVWTTLLCKMPNILQLVDVALSPLYLPFLRFHRFLLRLLPICASVCVCVGLGVWVCKDE